MDANKSISFRSRYKLQIFFKQTTDCTNLQKQQIDEVIKSLQYQYRTSNFTQMIGLQENGPKVLVSQHRIPSLIQNFSNQTTSQTLKQLLNNDIYVAISKYSDSFMVIINQTNTMGSIYKGKYSGEILPQIQEEDFDEMTENQNTNNFVTQKIYDIKCLFGSTEIEFYELLVRKILQILFEQNKTDPSINVLVNVSLPVKWKEWPEYEHKYYQAITAQVSHAFKELL